MSGSARSWQGRLFLTGGGASLDVETAGYHRLLPLLISDDLLHTRLQRQRSRCVGPR